jgi:hypothetical protein
MAAVAGFIGMPDDGKQERIRPASFAARDEN